MYKNMYEILNEDQIGSFKLKKYEIKKETRHFRCNVPDGKYIMLVDNSLFNNCIMSNTPMEERTNYDFIKKAHGDIFIAGLGIGMIILPVQEKEEVISITVLEKHPEIIELVGKQLPLNSKVKIIQGDVFDYEFLKGTKFDCIYFDIWNYVNKDIYEEMKQLKKKYRKYKKTKMQNPNAFINCWAEYEAKYNKLLI